MNNISVVVPVYNVESYLPRCVNCVLQQTSTDFELILVDDGSPDDSGMMCDEYLLSDERLLAIHQTNGGLSAARNSGIEWACNCSNSEWITFIDSDDWVDRLYLEVLYNANIENDTYVSVGGLQRIIEYNEPKAVSKPVRGAVIAARKFYSQDVEYDDCPPICACGKMFRKCLFEDIRFPVGRINEDRFTTHLVIFKNEYVSCIYEPLYYYFIRSGSIMRGKWTPKKLDDVDAHVEQLEYFKENGFDEAYRVIAGSYIAFLAKNIKEIKLFKDDSYKDVSKKLKRDLQKAILRFEKEKIVSVRKYSQIYEYAFPTYTKIVYCVHQGKLLLKKILK